MNILCSAGKGEMEHTACLACSRTGNQPCGYDYVVLRALYANHEDRPDIHVTDLTGCLRKAYYSKTQKIAETPHSKYAMMVGSLMHEGLEGSDEHMDAELPFSLDGVVGKADVVYKDGRLLDIKTTRWLYVNKVPYGSHALQVNIYAYFLKKSGRKVNRLQIQYLDMSGPTKCRKCRVPVIWVEGELKCPSCQKIFSNAHLGAALVEVPMMEVEEIESLINERKGELQTALEAGMPPAKEPGFLCEYCAFRSQCGPETNED